MSQIVTGASDASIDGLVSWLVCLSLMFTIAISSGSLYIFGIFFPFLLDEFMHSKSMTALIGSLGMCNYTFLSPISSKICLRFGSRLSISFGALLGALGFLISSFAHDLYVLYLSCGVMLGMAASIIYVAGFQIVPIYFDKHRFLATGVISLGPLAGLLMLSPVAQELSDNFGWRRAMKILAGLNLMSIVLSCSITRKIKAKNEESSVDSSSNSRRKKAACLSSLDFSLFKNLMFMVISISTSIFQLGNFCPYFHLAKFADELGIPGHHSSWMYFTIGVASVVSRIVAGKLLDIFHFNPLRFCQLSAIGFSITNCLVPSLRTFSLLIGYSLVNGIWDGMFGVAISSIMTQTYSGMGFGWFLSFQGVSFLIAPILSGYISDTTGSYDPVFYTSGGIMFFSFILFSSTFCIKTKTSNDSNELDLKETEELVVVDVETAC